VFKGEYNDNKGFSWMKAVSNAEPAYKLALSSAKSNVVRECIIFNNILEFYCDLFKWLSLEFIDPCY
jgi:hypothetical protein